MNTIKNKRIKYLLSLLILIFICEIMLQIDNKIVQCFGICILPIIVTYGILLFKNEQSQI